MHSNALKCINSHFKVVLSIIWETALLSDKVSSQLPDPNALSLISSTVTRKRAAVSRELSKLAELSANECEIPV